MPEPDPIVHIVDDDPSIRRALERLLRSAGYAVCTYSSPVAFLGGLPGGAGCAILDLAMPKMDGLELQRRLGAAGFTMPLLFLTGHGSVPDTVRAMKAGAQDFMEKPVEDEVLLQAVARMLAEDRRRAAGRRARDQALACLDTLTPRERQVLELVAAGLLNKQVAGKLGISEATVKVHRGRVMTKLGASSVLDLGRVLERAGGASRPVRPLAEMPAGRTR